MAEDLRFARIPTALGTVLLAATDVGVAAISRGVSTSSFLEALHRRFPGSDAVPDAAGLAVAASWLRGYLAGRNHEPAEVDLRGVGDWDARVFEAVRAIPYGRTATYGEVALAIGSPGAARAVGGSLARCPLFPAVPCHRVVRAVDGWSGWGGADIEVKRRLLALERG